MFTLPVQYNTEGIQLKACSYQCCYKDIGLKLPVVKMALRQEIFNRIKTQLLQHSDDIRIFHGEKEESRLKQLFNDYKPNI